VHGRDSTLTVHFTDTRALKTADYDAGKFGLSGWLKASSGGGSENSFSAGF